jgi:hypothetical protein
VQPEATGLGALVEQAETNASKAINVKRIVKFYAPP